MSRGNPALCAWLHDRIRRRGPMPFVEFMEAALYRPGLGYYLRPGATTGEAGDFYTSPDVHPAFGRLIARQIAELAARTLPHPGAPFQIVEMGPGTGRLARDIMTGLTEEHPALARRTRYTMVEVSPSLRDAQRRALDESGAATGMAGVEWAGWSELLERGDLSACVVANEFLDALPVRLVEWRGGRLLEVHVDSDGESFREVLADPAGDFAARHLESLAAEGVSLVEGQRAEIGQRALEWVSSLGRLFGAEGRGGAILVDYGHLARQLYDAGRHRGTLLCYHRHRAHDDPYVHVGEQDMTAHVDFTSVRRRAREAGFDATPPVSQMKFLVAHGLASMLADLASAPAPVAGGGASGLAARTAERMALHGLMAPGGMGDVFQVMLLARGTEAAGLTGARDPFAAPGPGASRSDGLDSGEAQQAERHR